MDSAARPFDGGSTPENVDIIENIQTRVFTFRCFRRLVCLQTVVLFAGTRDFVRLKSSFQTVWCCVVFCVIVFKILPKPCRNPLVFMPSCLQGDPSTRVSCCFLRDETELANGVQIDCHSWPTFCGDDITALDLLAL